MIGSWDMEGDRQNFFVIFGHFLLLYLTNNPKNQNFEKKKKKKLYYNFKIVYHKLYQMMYASWDMKCDQQLFVILGHFLLLCPT